MFRLIRVIEHLLNDESRIPAFCKATWEKLKTVPPEQPKTFRRKKEDGLPAFRQGPDRANKVVASVVE